jgi:hypothetical protein
MSECLGDGCEHAEHAATGAGAGSGTSGRVDDAPNGVAPEKWALLSRKERRVEARRLARRISG